MHKKCDQCLHFSSLFTVISLISIYVSLVSVFVQTGFTQTGFNLVHTIYKGGFQKNEVFFNIKAGLISFIHIRSHLYLKCVLSRCQTPCKIS